MFTRFLIAMTLLPGTAQSESLPAPTPPALYHFITVTDPYSEWSLLPGSTAKHDDRARSHDTHLSTRVNGIALEAIKAEQPIAFDPEDPLVLPVGSIVVKENYGAGLDHPPSLQVMYKYPGEETACAYPQCEAGWFFTYYEAGVTTEKSAPAAHCIACHTGVTSAPTRPANPAVESATYMLSLSDHVWGLFYQMVRAGGP